MGADLLSTPLTKLLIIGLDAAEKDLILRWAAEGKLPNFAKLLARSTRGFTENPLAMETGAVWASFYTGQPPSKHGLYYPFGQPVRGSYDLKPLEADDFTARPFWDELTRAGKRVAVIDAPSTFLSKTLNGIHVVDWGTHAPLGGFERLSHAFQTNPPELAREIEEKFGRDEIGYCDLLTFRSVKDYRRFRDQLLDRIRRKTELSLFILEKGGWDCFFTAFPECHCAGHQCWHFHDKSHPRYDKAMTEEIGDILELVYVEIDKGLGRLVERAGDGTDVMVYCSHGMMADYTGSLFLDDILLKLEGLGQSDAGKNTVRLIRSTFLGLPTWAKHVVGPLRLAWKPFRKTMLDPPQAKRSCFEVRNDDATGGIRLNLVGREPQGRIKPGAEADAFCAQLTEDLLELINPATGKPAVRRVYRAAEIYEGPFMDWLPDLFVEWDREGEIKSVSSPKVGVVENKDPPTRSGDHTKVGMVLMSGPSYAGRQLNQAISVYDLSPTINAMLGVEQRGVEGTVNAALMSNGAGT
jgi:predicted AlkP superfamily phosphohydrolase/phosphomutase